MTDPSPAETIEQPSSASPSNNTLKSDEKLIAAISYVPMLFIMGSFMKPKSQFCQMHAKQGMALSGITFIVLMILVIIPLIGSLLFLGLIALLSISAFQAYSGNQWEIPVLYGLIKNIDLFGSSDAPETNEDISMETETSNEEPPRTPSETNDQTPNTPE